MAEPSPLSPEKLDVSVIEAIVGRGFSATRLEIETDVAANLGLTDDDPENGGILGLGAALTGTLARGRAAGWLRSTPRGVWHLDGVGDVDAVHAATVDGRRRGAGPVAAHRRGPSDPGGRPEWHGDLLAVMAAMDPAGFEHLTGRLLRELEFENVVVDGRTGDGGIDGYGVVRLGLIGFTVVFQCKRQTANVGAPVLRDLRGAMDGRAEKGLLVTTADFTPAARSEAGRFGARRIELVDGSALCDLLGRLSLGISVDEDGWSEIDHDFFRSFEAEAARRRAEIALAAAQRR